MKLVKTKVGPFRSINEPQEVAIDPEVTVLVGMNEAGKTVFLKALHKANDALNKENFNVTDDYPRKDLTAYKKRHEEDAEEVVILEYVPTDEQIVLINNNLGTEIPKGYKVIVGKDYKNNTTVYINISDLPTLKKMANNTSLSSEAKEVLMTAKGIRGALTDLLELDAANESDKKLIESLQKKVDAANKTKGWENICSHEAWNNYFKEMIPKFLYFSDYDLLPGKLNLKDLKLRVDSAKADPVNAHKQIEPKHQAVLALLRMADVSLDDFDNKTTYEELKSQIEAVSISLTDQVLEFWKQNEDLEVEIDIRSDSSDASPFNDGPNIYLRIKNRRHRGVSTPFDQRSRGFIWFFSFLVWFDSVQYQIDPSGKSTTKNLIILLDEPALALHALAQTDFLNYIDNLSKNHQVIYTTHSPFMVHSDRLHQVRVVEDRPKLGTILSDNLSGSDSRTIFPLQAALGWNLAQNLFIGKINLLVEGVSELAILQTMSKLVESTGNPGLISQATIVPAGGLSNVATFVSLLNSNGLNISILHDYDGKPEQKLESLIHQKLLKKKSVFNFSQFRDLSQIGKDGAPTDVEDLIDIDVYLKLFCDVFKKQLDGKVIDEKDLPEGDRIVQRLEKYLSKNSIKIRPSGGYNHYAVASAFATNTPENLSNETINRFAELFKEINSSFK